jgi:hypothetical protein
MLNGPYATRITITVGIGRTHDGRSILEDESRAALSHARTTACHLFGGVTITTGEGSWIDPDTEVRHDEPVAVLTIVTHNAEDRHRQIQTIAEYLADVLNQTAVMVTTELIRTSMIPMPARG